VSQVDLLARIIRLNPGETKNGEGRTVTLTESCYILVLELMKGKRSDDSSCLPVRVESRYGIFAARGH
jgi:hypothetical protein